MSREPERLADKLRACCVGHACGYVAASYATMSFAVVAAWGAEPALPRNSSDLALLAWQSGWLLFAPLTILIIGLPALPPTLAELLEGRIPPTLGGFALFLGSWVVAFLVTRKPVRRLAHEHGRAESMRSESQGPPAAIS